MLRRDERPGHRLDQPARGENAAGEALTLLRLGEHGTRHARLAAHRRGRHVGDTCETHHLFDEIDRSGDVGPPGGGRRLELLTLAVERDAEGRQQVLDLAVPKLEPAEALDQAEIELERSVRLRRLAGELDLAGLSAAQIKHERCGNLEPRHDKIGIDAALEPIARIG